MQVYHMYPPMVIKSVIMLNASDKGHIYEVDSNDSFSQILKSFERSTQ